MKNLINLQQLLLIFYIYIVELEQQGRNLDCFFGSVIIKKVNIIYQVQSYNNIN